MKITQQSNPNYRNYGRKSHNRLQRDIIEDMNVYEMSFEDWNDIDDIEYQDDIDYQDDMDVSCNDYMMVDYDRYDYDELMTPTEAYTDVMDDSNNEVSYPWRNTAYEAKFLFTHTSYSLWITKSVVYGIPDEITKTLAMLEWLETQGGVYLLLLNGSTDAPPYILGELKRSVFWSYTFMILVSRLQVKVKPNHMSKFGLHFNGLTYYTVDGCLDIYSRAYEGCMKLLKIAQRRFV